VVCRVHLEVAFKRFCKTYSLNLEGTRKLSHELRRYFPGDPFLSVFGILEEKKRTNLLLAGLQPTIETIASQKSLLSYKITNAEQWDPSMLPQQQQMQSFISHPLIPNLIPDSETGTCVNGARCLVSESTDIKANDTSFKDEYHNRKVIPRSKTTDTNDPFYSYPPKPVIPPMKPFFNPFDALTTLNEAEDCIYDINEDGPFDRESRENSRSKTTDTNDPFYSYPPKPVIPPMKLFVNPSEALTTLNEAEDCIYDIDEDG